MNDNIRLVPAKHRTQGFLYLERAKIHRDEYSFSVVFASGESIKIPATQFYAFYLGRGATVSHDAVMLAAEVGLVLLWVGDGIVRFYAEGNPTARSSKIIMRQAELVSSRSKRLSVARAMYQKRFPGEDVSTNSMQQLLGKEGTRVRKAYSETAAEFGLEWEKRISRMKNMAEDDLANKAITIAASALYGICHATITAIGASPALGFIHTGTNQSFVYDVSDLYKTRICVPAAFQVVSESRNFDSVTLDKLIRIRMREVFAEQHIARSIVEDIKDLFADETIFDELGLTPDLYIWNDKQTLLSGRNFGEAK